MVGAGAYRGRVSERRDQSEEGESFHETLLVTFISGGDGEISSPETYTYLMLSLQG